MAIRLSALVHDVYKGEVPSWCAAWEIDTLHADSRHVTPGSMFIAVPGVTGIHGSTFVADAVARGARVVVVESTSTTVVEKVTSEKYGDACIIPLFETTKLLRLFARRIYGNPSQKVKVIGVTGTNGKTTITYLIESILAAAGQRCGVISTVNYRWGTKVMPAPNTTPSFLDVQQFLFSLATETIPFCVMEVTSHALVQGRVDGIDFDCGVFTNLTGDHLDYHKTMENYFEAKALLFADLGPDALAVINVDDPYGVRLVSKTEAERVRYGGTPQADVYAENVQLSAAGTTFTVVTPDGKGVITTPFIGKHNMYNILAAAAVCRRYGVPLSTIATGIANLKCVPGRLERVDCGQDFHVFVDFAHTHDALENVLTSIRAISDSRIILVFGCGGNRDKTKRPRMGSVAAQYADTVIVTSDNPRDEDPQAIIEDILVGFHSPPYAVSVDRTEAIHRALSIAKKGDVVLLAGKGHEDYQIIRGTKYPFSEKQIIHEFFKKHPRN